jgi:hypothetical protein
VRSLGSVAPDIVSTVLNRVAEARVWSLSD